MDSEKNRLNICWWLYNRLAIGTRQCSTTNNFLGNHTMIVFLYTQMQNMQGASKAVIFLLFSFGVIPTVQFWHIWEVMSNDQKIIFERTMIIMYPNV